MSCMTAVWAGRALGVAVGMVLLSRAWSSRAAKRPIRILVMRHGLKEANTPDRDNFELALLPEAYDGLKVLRAYLEAHDIRIRTVLTSPFRRARETAAFIAPSAKTIIEPGLCEVLSDNCGLLDGSGGPGTLTHLIKRVENVVHGMNVSCKLGAGLRHQTSRVESADLVDLVVPSTRLTWRLVATGPIIEARELERDPDLTFMACMRRSCELLNRLVSDHSR